MTSSVREVLLEKGAPTKWTPLSLRDRLIITQILRAKNRASEKLLSPRERARRKTLRRMAKASRKANR